MSLKLYIFEFLLRPCEFRSIKIGEKYCNPWRHRSENRGSVKIVRKTLFFYISSKVNSTNYWWFSGVNFASGPLKLEVYLNNRHVATETILVSNNLFYSPWFLVCLFIILTVSNKVFLSYRESIIDS